MKRSDRFRGCTALVSLVLIAGCDSDPLGNIYFAEPFGDRVDPVYGTKTPNPGILLDTQSAADVRAVFDGQVVEVSVLPDFGTYVAIEHGDYQTIYSNFSATFVSEGQRVRAGQVIGRAGTDAEPRGRAVFFGLFTSKRFIDPEPWLQGR